MRCVATDAVGPEKRIPANSFSNLIERRLRQPVEIRRCKSASDSCTADTLPRFEGKLPRRFPKILSI